VVSAPRLVASRGDRIGLVGPNGAGKTTLLRTIYGELTPLAGYVRLGAAVQPAYLAQVRRAAPVGATVLDALLGVANVESDRARGYLARFLFRGEDVFKPVAELSGGERSRLELALLGVSAANLLLLDEPTNHLDIPAREALESFLRESPATLIVVSHDRRLLESICETLWVVVESTGDEPATVIPFEGGYSAWRVAVTAGWPQGAAPVRGQSAARSAAAEQPATPAGQDPARPAGGLTAAASRGSSRPRLSKDAYRRRREVVEDDLTRLGLRRNQLELALADPQVQANYVELRRLTSELADVEAALNQAEDAWLVLAEQAPRR
jgi:ATP-binding cassette subfamily F protein 3